MVNGCYISIYSICIYFKSLCSIKSKRWLYNDNFVLTQTCAPKSVPVSNTGNHIQCKIKQWIWHFLFFAYSMHRKKIFLTLFYAQPGFILRNPWSPQVRILWKSVSLQFFITFQLWKWKLSQHLHERSIWSVTHLTHPWLLRHTNVCVYQEMRPCVHAKSSLTSLPANTGWLAGI